jgi:hypothetical protein
MIPTILWKKERVGSSRRKEFPKVGRAGSVDNAQKEDKSNWITSKLLGVRLLNKRRKEILHDKWTK